jgi:hypothetical protein
VPLHHLLLQRSRVPRHHGHAQLKKWRASLDDWPNVAVHAGTPPQNRPQQDLGRDFLNQTADRIEPGLKSRRGPWAYKRKRKRRMPAATVRSRTASSGDGGGRGGWWRGPAAGEATVPPSRLTEGHEGREGRERFLEQPRHLRECKGDPKNEFDIFTNYMSFFLRNTENSSLVEKHAYTLLS